MIHSKRSLWAPKGPFTAREKAMVACYLPISEPVSEMVVSRQARGGLEGWIQDLPEAEQMDLADQLEAPWESPSMMAEILMERSAINEILSRVDWGAQTADQPPSPSVQAEMKTMTIWDYLDSAMVMR